MVQLDEGGIARHSVRLIAPPSGHPLVEHFWILRSTGASAIWRIVPDTHPHVIFTATMIRGRLRTEGHLVGARSTFADVALDGRILTVGARLRPGALPLILGRPAYEVTDRGLPIPAIAGGTWRDLLTRMSMADATGAVRSLAALLNRRSATTDRLEGALTQAHRVGRLAARLCVTPRELHAEFRQNLGLPPKLALRIARLHRAMRGLNRDWPIAAVATAAGFSDQAHLTREFSVLVGEPPAAWRRRGRATTSALRRD
jgi:AraC-like DNA-binding protein